MNTNAALTFTAPHPLLSARVRIVAALAVTAAVALAWSTTERASHRAVQSAGEAMSRSYVTLPTAQIMVRREPVSAATARAV